LRGVAGQIRHPLAYETGTNGSAVTGQERPAKRATIDRPQNRLELV
jgi:hypothetical protein